MNRKASFVGALVLVGVLLFSLGALAKNDTLVVGTAAEAIGLDPRLENDVPSFERINVIMEPLVKFDVEMNLQPVLAKSWEVSDDTTTLTFQLQEGVIWHDGTPFSAEDVKYTFEWVLNPANGAPNLGLYNDIGRIEVVSATEIILHLDQPNSFLLNNIARMPITPKHDGDRTDFRQKPIGTGPYKLVSWARDDRMILVENEEYWGGRAVIPNLIFRPITEDATRLLAFEAGELDFFQGNVVPQEIDRLEADPKIIVQRAPGTGYTYLGFNFYSPILDDLRVRQAIAHLINREGIVTRILNGIGTPGVSPVSIALPWFNPDVPRFEYNVEKSKALLAEAGYEPGDIKIRLFSDEANDRIRIAELIQFEAQQVGITVEVTVEEWGAYLARILETDDFDIYLLSWVGQLDPDRALYRQFHTDGSNNEGHYSNTELDELLERGRAVPPDSQESFDIYSKAQEIIVGEVPYAFIYYTEEVGIQHPWIENWVVHPYAAASFQDAHRIVKNK